MNFGEAISSVFSKYATFSGRARRSEYWYFYLFNLMVSIVISFIPFVNMLAGLWSLVVLIPSIAVTVRRFHDTGKSGWWYIVMILPGIAFTVIFFILLMKVLIDSGIYLDLDDFDDYYTIESIKRVLLDQSALLIAMGVTIILSLIFNIWKLVWLVTDSEPGENEYGQNPKETTSTQFGYNGNTTNID